MSGLINNGLPQQSVFTGSELLNLDTQLTAGQPPQSSMTSLLQLAMQVSWLINNIDITPVSGTRYYAQVNLGAAALLTGVQFRIGATGGTNNALVELHNSTGALVATSALAGVLVGTANTYQRIAFTSTYQAVAGTYYIALQLNGTTARISGLNAPSLPLFTGSATGVFGTSAAITPPTTYTAGVGPVATLY